MESNDSTRGRDRAVWGPRLGLLLLFGASWLQQDSLDFKADDAFISYRYALNWAEGHGPVFNIGERVEGYTNFLLVGFLALSKWLGGDVDFVSRLAGTLSCWGVIGLVYCVLTSSLKRGWRIALAGAAAAALHSGLSLWARAGLETVPMAFFVLLALFVFLKEDQAGRVHAWSGLLLGVVALIRADGFLYFGVTASYLLVLRRPWARLASLAVPFLAVVVPYLLWRWTYYGDLLPNTYYLKTGGDIYQQIRGLFYTYNFVVPFGGIFLFGLPLVLVVLRDARRDLARLCLGLLVAVLSAYIVWIGGDHMPLSRLYMPLAAPLIILLVEAATELARLVPSTDPASGRRREVLHGVFLALIVFSGLLPTLNPRRPPYSYAIEHRTLVERWSMAGKWLRREMPPDTLLATNPAGAVPYFSRLPTVDMLGVNDRHIAHLTVPTMGHGTAGHEKRDFDYVLSRKPDIIFRDVRDRKCSGEETKVYSDGSVYQMRCASLGRGPQASQFGEVQYKELFIWYERRTTTPSPTEP